MSLQVAIIDIATPTSTGTQTYTPGFQATALIAFGGESTGNGTTANASIFQGFAVSSSSQVCVGTCAKDAAASGTYNKFSYQDVSNLVNVSDAAAGPLLVAGAVSSITSTTFVINFTTVDASARHVTIIAIGARRNATCACR